MTRDDETAVDPASHTDAESRSQANEDARSQAGAKPQSGPPAHGAAAPRMSRDDLLAGAIRSAGERLAWVREQAGLSLTNAATGSGISKPELSRLENDTRQITGRHLAALAPVYGVTVADLRQLLDFSPTERMAVLAVREEPAPPRTGPVPTYGAASLQAHGPSVGDRVAVGLPTRESLGPDVYGIRHTFVPGYEVLAGGWTVVADPACRATLNHLVVNPVGWSPLIGTLARDGDGVLRLEGTPDPDPRLPDGVGVTDMHPVVMLLPHAFPVAPCPADGEPGVLKRIHPRRK